MNAFLTGSRRYGVIKPDSDVDLVVLVDDITFGVLKENADEVVDKSRPNYPCNNASMRFGKLNMIVQTKEPDFAAWRLGTQQLVREGPVTRDRAKEVFTELLKRVGGR